MSSSIRSTAGRRRTRIVLYSHDGMGIGHIRRNLLIAEAIAGAMPDSSILLIAGICEAGAFTLPKNVDCLTLPSLCKTDAGAYRPRRLTDECERVARVRSQIIRAAIEGFEPHAMIVDKVPRGVARELESTLRFLRDRGTTRCVLGIRDILDDPDTVRREWHRHANEDAVADFYDAIWVYGDRNVYDLAAEYEWSPATVSKIAYAGYLKRATRRHDPLGNEAQGIRASLKLPADRRVMLCGVGGGEDGGPLAEAFAAARIPDDAVGVILAGPFMPEAVRQRLARAVSARPQLRVFDFLPDPTPLVRIADRAVTMGGYNCVAELLCAGTPTLVVPRVQPRQEQLIRAQRLAKAGLIEMLHPSGLTSAAIGDWLAKPTVPFQRSLPDFEGLARLPALLEDLIDSPVAPKESAAESGEAVVA